MLTEIKETTVLELLTDCQVSMKTRLRITTIRMSSFVYVYVVLCLSHKLHKHSFS